MLKYHLLLSVLALLYSQSIAQTNNFEDGFEDGDFTNNPTWSGDIGDFLTIDGTLNFLLQLDAVGTGPSYLSTPSSNINGSWEFYIEFDGFEPSGSNQAEVFLMSDIADLEGSVNGYAIQAGESGDDVFRIVRYDNGSEAADILSDTTVIDSNGGGYRVKVTRNNSGNWQLEVGTGYDGQLFDSGNTATDNTHTSSSHFGVKTNFTSTRSDRFFFDFKIDLPPFTVEDVSQNGNIIDVTFNRPYDQATVQASDFSVDKGVGTPSSINFSSATVISLAYENSLSSDKYSLVVNNIDDENGESIEPNTMLNFIVFGTFSDGDVQINEFMYDPPTGLPEYVELRNISSKYLNIKDWQLGDQNGIGTITNDTLAFAVDSFMVLSPDTTALFNQFGSRNYIEMSSSSFPSLNNSGDAIRIFTKSSVTADSFFYTPDWGGEDIALERRSPAAPSSKMANWGDSPQGTGTPGSVNQIPPDQTSPEFTDLQIINPTTLRLIFSEELGSESATKAHNYAISPDPDIQLISSRSDTVTLFLANELQSQQLYQVTVSNLRDIFGNALNMITREVTFVEFSPIQPREILINEILYTRAAGGGPEFIELYNTSAKNFDLSGWEIGDASGAANLSTGGQLLTGEYLVLTDDITFANSLDNAQYVPGFPTLNDSGDNVFLRTPEGVIVDSLNYSSTWGGEQSGRSLERKDPLAASNDASNWTTSTVNNENTPGTQNSVFQPDESPPGITFAKRLPDNIIEVQLNEFIRLTPDLTFSTNGAALTIVEFDSTNANIVTLNAPSGKLKSAASSSITVQNLTDIRGNVTASANIPIAQPLAPSDIVINEIMYNPLDDGDDNKPDQSEYVELRNTRDFAVSMEGIFLNDAPDEDGEVRALVPVSTRARWIPANSIMLIYADEEPDFEQSNIAQFFDLTADSISSPIRIDRTTLSLASSNDAVYLSDSTGATIDSVFYDESWHNPNLLDTRGVALERISPTGPSSHASNWSSSTLVKGGTPDSENSIYQSTNNPPNQTGISFSPNPFSPDDDGSEDNLFINYKLDEPDYLLKVRIYDRYGRLVRKLADGRQAGFEGSLIWNGRKNDGGSNRIGIYIVVFEAFNSASGSDVAFKETVVLARRLN